MKQSRIEFRRFLRELWHELLRWTMLVFLIGSVLALAVMVHFRIGITILPFLVMFFISLCATWILLFRKQPKRKDFEGDR